MAVLKEKNNSSLIKLNKIKKDFKIIDLDILKKSELVSSLKKIDIIVLYSDYNISINKSLLNGYLNSLQDSKYRGSIAIMKVPGGAFELPLLTLKIIKKYKPKICLVIGCIIKGDTKHYEFLSSTVINAIRNISFDTTTPILNGILTVENNQQAIDRAGIKMNKGSEYANVSIDILNFTKKFNV